MPKLGLGLGISTSRPQASGGGGGTFLLDLYPNAKLAWSLRRLNGAYTGKVVNLNRGVDNIQVDVDFDGDAISMDSIVTATSGSTLATNLGEFVWATGYSNPDSLIQQEHCTVAILYDQSGNSYNGVNGGVTNQPGLIVSGAFLMDGGRPTMELTSAWLEFPSFTVASENMGITLSKKYGTSFQMACIDKKTPITTIYSLQATVFHHSYQQRIFISDNTDTWSAVQAFDTRTLWSNTRTGGAISVYKDGDSALTLQYWGAYPRDIDVDGYGSNTGMAGRGNFQEIIFYNIDKSSDRVDIITDLNTYYSIYP